MQAATSEIIYHLGEVMMELTLPLTKAGAGNPQGQHILFSLILRYARPP